MKRLLLILVASLALPAAPAFARQQPGSKPAVLPADYGRWESLAAAQLSPDGAWLAYGIQRVDEENELRIRAVARDSTRVVRYATAPQFSADSRWLAYAIGLSPAERERLEEAKKPVRNALGLLDLRSGDTLTVAGIASFAFSGDGRFLVMRAYPPEDGEGGATDLLVRELATGSTSTFGNVTSFEWSDAAPLLAMTVTTDAGAGNGVQVYDAASGRLRVLDSSGSNYRGLAWRDDADDLAVLRARADSTFRDTTHVVLAFHGLVSDEPERHELDPAVAQAIPDSLRIAEAYAPHWSEDGATVFIGLRPRIAAPAEPAHADTAPADSGADVASDADTTAAAKDGAKPEKISDVQVWHARDVRIIPMQRAQEQRDLRRTLLAAWHPADGTVIRVGTDLMNDAEPLRGARYATESTRKPYPFGEMFGRHFEDVDLVDLRTGDRHPAVRRIRYFFGGSPGGRYLLYFRDHDFFTYDVSTGTETNLTGKLGSEFGDTAYDYPVKQLPPYGVGGWLADGSGVLLYDRFDVWRVAPDGTGGRRLTAGAADSVVHRIVTLDEDEETDGIDPSRPIYLSLFGEYTKRSGFARLDPDGKVERLQLEDARTMRLARADSAAVFAFTRERFDDSPDWFVGGPSLRDARQVSRTNPFQSDFAWGHSELVDFTSQTGRKLQGVLLYPANYDASVKYPMIVYTYELLSQRLHWYVVPSERNYYDFASFTQEGYFVLLPDIVYRPRDPGRSAVEAVVPAVQSIIARGIVDPARIGLVGHSWGGYQATYIPTQTDIFAASVAGAPLTNFLSMMGAIHWNPGLPETDHWETGQARMDVPYWEDFEAHVRNSPAAFITQLHTPMLMTFGDADGTVDWHQGIQFYNFARRAGKEDFVLLVYPGEDHGLRKKVNQIDYHRRILQWFGHWLKGEPAPKWMTEGVTWLERKRALEDAEPPAAGKK